MTIFGRRVPMMASLIVWCLIWEVLGRLDLVFLLPPFTHVLATVVDLFQSPKFHQATLTTLRAFAYGMGLAIAARIPLGLLMGRVKAASTLLGCGVDVFVRARPSALALTRA